MSTTSHPKAIRLRHGWSQQQMAEYLGVDRSTVSRIETGKKIPGPVQRLLDQLDTTDAEGAR